MSSLKDKSISGVVWAIFEKFGVNGVKLILGIILARILSPEDFGLIGMITVFFVVAQVFVDSGFAMAYVQKREINDADADTIFFTNLIIGIILYIILFFCAPLIARFYDQEQLINLIRVMAIVIIINAFNVIQKAQIIRSVNFKKLSKVTLTSSILSGIIAIFTAYKGLGVWALVIQSLVSRFIISIGFWFSTDYRPTWRFSIISFKEMFTFGSWMLFSNLVRTFFDNIYLLAIGKIFPTAQLGYYSKAKQLVSMSLNTISVAIGSVAFPVYASLQNDKEKLKKAMKGFIQYTMFFLIPLVSILIIVAKPFILLLLTDKWAPMVPIFQAICLTAILYPLNQINTQTIIALGKSKLSFNLELGRNFFRLINIIITYRFGVLQMIIGEVVISIVFFFINANINKNYTDYGISKQLNDMWKILLGGFLASIIAYCVLYFINNLILWLIAGILVTGISYLIIEYFINRKLYLSSIGLLRNLILNKK